MSAALRPTTDKSVVLPAILVFNLFSIGLAYGSIQERVGHSNPKKLRLAKLYQLLTK
jgi:hypothetical protein